MYQSLNELKPRDIFDIAVIKKNYGDTLTANLGAVTAKKKDLLQRVNGIVSTTSRPILQSSTSNLDGSMKRRRASTPFARSGADSRSRLSIKSFALAAGFLAAPQIATVSVPQGKSVKQSEDFLVAKHNQLNRLESVADLVLMRPNEAKAAGRQSSTTFYWGAASPTMDDDCGRADVHSISVDLRR